MHSPSYCFYKVIISYKGTNYRGWQYQTDTTETVQNYVEEVIKNIVKFQKFQIITASRTDSGVHASGQVIKLGLPKEIDPDHLTLGMNTKLPPDIRVVSTEITDQNFNPNRDPTSKEYHYYFTLNKSQKAALSDIIYYYPENLDIELIQKACEKIIGTHNFKNFCTVGSKDFNFTRTISHCSIEKTNFSIIEPEVFYLKIKGNGFLKYMVRNLMYALIEIGNGELSVDELVKFIDSQEILRVKKKAPAHGLHLIKVNYPC